VTIQEFITTNLEICDKATEGPWLIHEGTIAYGPDNTWHSFVMQKKERLCDEDIVATRDFIAASRLALPKALKALELAARHLELCTHGHAKHGLDEMTKILGGGENVKP